MARGWWFHFFKNKCWCVYHTDTTPLLKGSQKYDFLAQKKAAFCGFVDTGRALCL